MKLLYILLIALIIYIVYKNTDKIITNKETFDSSDDYLNDLSKYVVTDKYNDDTNKALNIVFIEGQYHTDYRDTVTGFNNIVPSQKQIFNQENVPIKFTNPDLSEVQKLIKDFIKELNKNIMTEVGDTRTSNSGWDEIIPEKTIESGWEKQMRALNLPTNLYPEPAKKSKVILVAIDHIEKYETDNEIKYSCFLFLQKKNIKDQLVIKVSFVLNKKSVNLDRKFFDSESMSPDDPHVIIEEIFILGYLTSDGNTGATKKTPDDFYKFSGLENQDILDRGVIIKELIKKYKSRTKDMNYFNASLNGFNASLANFNGPLDKEQTEFRKEVPHLMNSKSYQVTQTIEDDLNNKNRIMVHGKNN